MRQNYLFTSESVSEGHPDKVADQISDAIVDLFLSKDPEARVACETLTTTNRVVLAGEIRGEGVMDRDGNWAPGIREEIEAAARDAVKSIGYEQDGFHWQTFDFANHLHAQSSDIAQGVDAAGNKDEGAGDQGLMFGYACTETDQLMPAPIHYSHAILKSLAEARHSGSAPGLGPDAKSQVTLRYANGKPVGATSIVVSTQHDAKLEQEEVREIVRPHVLNVLPKGWMCPEPQFYVNPTGRFVIGGPDGDCGLTGRKIIVDTYGGSSPHGGGAFSGKDPTKVDRSAAYAARYLAKNVVAAKLAEKCVIQVAYAIGVSKPLSVYVDTYGTSKVDEEKLSRVLQELMDLSPRGIRQHLGLNKPIYARTAAYGHFGRAPEADQRRLLDELLPQLAVALPSTPPLDLTTLFGGARWRHWLEIGFGGGEHLVWQASHHPDVGLIGSEPFVNGMVSALGHIKAAGVANVRLWPEPAAALLDALPDGGLERVFVLFPDPWPKVRHHKRRFIQRANLDRLARLMAPGAELRVATDDPDYGHWILAALLDHPAFAWLARRPADWRERPADWPPTRYEAKARAAGRNPVFLRFERR